ncbi:MAG: LLM class oxidoreductase [Bacteroidota bacterium]
MTQFPSINPGYARVFQAGKLSVGVVVPIENYARSSVPTMTEHVARVQQLEELGFAALWIRDIPLQVPSFGDAGQTFDPFTYLGFLAGQTSEIALGVSSIALPLHHPVHVAKAAATIDQLSGGRMLLGVASGDRYEEYPGLGISYESRGERFQEAFAYLRKAAESFPELETSAFGRLNGKVDILPKPFGEKLPLLITGRSRQSLEWNVENGDGWMSYPKNIGQQTYLLKQWRGLIEESGRGNLPFMQPLYVDLVPQADAKPTPIHLGFRLGVKYLVDYFQLMQDIGVNHVAINLRFNQAHIPDTLHQLAEHLLPHFPTFQPQSHLS